MRRTAAQGDPAPGLLLPRGLQGVPAELGGPRLPRRRQELPPGLLEGGARDEARFQERPRPPTVPPQGSGSDPSKNDVCTRARVLLGLEVQHLRQHAGHDGEVRQQPGDAGRRAHAAPYRGEKAHGGAAPRNAPQDGRRATETST